MEKKRFDRLKKLYEEMDLAWSDVASQYGFICTGCSENCCETEFYHHTLIEKDYLLSGLKLLPSPTAVSVKKMAQKVCTKRNIAAGKGENLRIMCPLNREGRCILYAFRPMICRLHGIPHELVKPDGSSLWSPGCSAGAHLFENYMKFDRTPFYKELAYIEREYLSSLGKMVRNRQTIAQMIAK